jgi:hypothetical protein
MMNNTTPSPRWFTVIQYAVLGFLLLFIIGASLTSNSNLTAIFIGVFIAVLVSLFGGRVLAFVKAAWEKVKMRGKLALGACLFIALVLVCLFIGTPVIGFLGIDETPLYEPQPTPTASGGCNKEEPPIHKLTIEGYEVFIAPVTPDEFENTFTLNELYSYVISERAWDNQACRYQDSVIIDTGEFPSTRQVTSEKLNIFLDKVYVDTSEPLTIELPDGKEVSDRLCDWGPYCVEAVITLKNMPKNSFYQFKYGEFILEPRNELDQQTVKWSVSDLSDGIQFTYLREPYNDFYPVVLPLLEIDSIPVAITSVVGFLGGIVVEPVLKNMAQKRYQQWLDKRRKRKG